MSRRKLGRSQFGEGEESEREEDERSSERGRDRSPVASNPLRCYMKEVITAGGGEDGEWEGGWE